MSLKANKCLRIGFAALFFVYGSFLYAQVDYNFIRHLHANKLYREHLAYLEQLDSLHAGPDSISFLRAKYYLTYFNDSLFFLNYSRSKSLFFMDTSAVALAGIKYLKRPVREQSQWFNSLRQPAGKCSEKIQIAWNAAVSPRDVDPSVFPSKVQIGFRKYQKYQARKPAIAAALSAAVPGLGKLYAGRKNSFYITLLTHIGLGIQSYEAASRLGMKNPFTIFSFGFFGVFYAANVYGSYNSLKEVKHETRTQFLIDASDYYNINCDCHLY